MSLHARSQIKWHYGMCPLDADAERFGPFADLVALWQSRSRPSNLLPRRRDIDFYDLTEWLGRVFIARVERDPFKLRFTLWGTLLTDWWGTDYTNRVLGERSSNPQLWNLVETRYFEAMDQEPFIGLASGYLSEHGRPYIKVIGVDLPFADEDGLSHVLSAHIKIGMDESIDDVVPGNPIRDYF